jgi:hypothetical protein
MFTASEFRTGYKKGFGIFGSSSDVIYDIRNNDIGVSQSVGLVKDFTLKNGIPLQLMVQSGADVWIDRGIITTGGLQVVAQPKENLGVFLELWLY